ncbi:hypothetical protein [Mesoaciditoga lauensis]|uniref:hypothetical protein n=1 Tax=Mesoaciditoga lauensis TaxID=1495039 RepID=UPI000563CA75|nr:hypothetical protein [Mesoaciditoga lauensis]
MISDAIEFAKEKVEEAKEVIDAFEYQAQKEHETIYYVISVHLNNLLGDIKGYLDEIDRRVKEKGVD